jgi:Domain of unknown function (DUF1835)
MIYHILNGDALTERFKETNIPGEILVMRECLIEGDLGGDTLEAFIEHRTRYLATTYQADQNAYSIGSLIDKINHAPDHTEFNLWFEYDLFCQVNMWFLMSLMVPFNSTKKILSFILFGRHRLRDIVVLVRPP